MESIARESREQASAIEEVNIAVRQMDEMTQHNAALVEETNAAIEQTEGQANELDQIVAVFTTGGAAAVAPVTRAAAPVRPATPAVRKAAKASSQPGQCGDFDRLERVLEARKQAGRILRPARSMTAG
jgi:methyl-accepting chemotaxis protein